MSALPPESGHRLAQLACPLSPKSRPSMPGCSGPEPPLRLFPRRLERAFDILHGRELDVPELDVHPFDPAHIDVVNDVARFRVDGHWPARAFPRHAFHCANEAVAVRLAARFSDRFIDEMHAVIA